MAKQSQARSAGKVYVPPGHKLSCDPKYSPDMCSPDSIGSYIFLKTAGNEWQFAKMVEHGNIWQRGGGRSGSRVPLVVRERAVAWSRFATGAVTMMTRHPRALRSHTSEFHAEYMIWERSGSRGVCLVVREGAGCLVALRDGRCDNDDATFDNFRSYILGGRVAVIGEAEVPRVVVVRASAVDSSRYATIYCDNGDGHR